MWVRGCVRLLSLPYVLRFINFHSFPVNKCLIHKVIICNYPLLLWNGSYTTPSKLSTGSWLFAPISSHALCSPLPPPPVWKKEIKRDKRPDTQTLWIWLSTWMGSLYLLRCNYTGFFFCSCLTLFPHQLNSDVVVVGGSRWEGADWVGMSLWYSQGSR